MAKDSLTHWRTPGSKNGVRLYQYEDGTWTPDGLERRRAEYRRMNNSPHKGARVAIGVAGTAGALGSTVAGGVTAFKNEGNKERAFAPGKDGKPSKMEKITRSSSDIIKSTSDINDILASDKKKYRALTDDLTNEELERMIRRMSLEKQYSELIERDKENGKNWINSALGVVGGMAAIGGSVAGIITAIAAIKKAKD